MSVLNSEDGIIKSTISDFKVMIKIAQERLQSVDTKLDEAIRLIENIEHYLDHRKDSANLINNELHEKYLWNIIGRIIRKCDGIKHYE